MHFILWLLMQGSICVHIASSQRCDESEFLCDDGKTCIWKSTWCDSYEDCPDGSDEMYCNGELPCLSSHIACKNGKCVPPSALCDRYDDCGDSSDEEDCSSDRDQAVASTSTSFERAVDATGVRNVTVNAIVKAARYLLNHRNGDYGWDEFTSRALVAVSFANRVVPVAEREQMIKQLNIKLLSDIMKGNVTLSSLALYINALYATCQEPRNFQGIDLIARLRMETNGAITSNSSLPIAFLTLCIADELKVSDAYQLAQMYNSGEFSRISSRALLLMAMICYTRMNRGISFEPYIKNFLAHNPGDKADMHSKALIMQTLHAIGHPTDIEKLAATQLPDGSFGDTLATYYAIPVLMKSSFLEMRCNASNRSGMRLENLVRSSTGKNRVVYSLWISTENGVNSHSLTLTFDDDRSFFEIMQMASTRDPLYKFKVDETNDGKQVYSIAGIPNDVENGKTWMLYHGSVDRVTVNSVQNLRLESENVDTIPAENGSHFVFWFKRMTI